MWGLEGSFPLISETTFVGMLLSCSGYLEESDAPFNDRVD